VGLARRISAGGVDGFDSAPLEYHLRINHAYRMMAREEPCRWVVIDANRSVELVQNDLLQRVSSRLGPWRSVEGSPRNIER